MAAFFIPAHLYGFVVCLGYAALLVVLIPISSRHLPAVPAARQVPDGKTMMRYTITRWGILMRILYQEYPDVGLLVVSNMIFDPAMQAIFAAAILILEGVYHFTAAEIPIILGVGILMSVPGVMASRWIVSFQGSPDSTAANMDNGTLGDSLLRPDMRDSLRISASGFPIDRKHSTVMLWSVIIGLGSLSAINISAPFILQKCNLGIACALGALWGFCLAFVWNSFGMLKTSLVPGGHEAEVASVFQVTANLVNWLPLFVVSLAVEIWTIQGAMWSLVVFYVIGICALLCVNLDRALSATLKSLENRRWAN